MPLDAIKRNEYPQPDRMTAQDAVIKAVESAPELFLDRYARDERSFGGRYVAADLFKETFPIFNESKEARNRYNGPVHNSAAVLSAEQLRRMLADQSQQQRTAAVFLTGIPGAGKTSSVLAGGQLPDDCRVIFEGQLSNPVTTIDKIGRALDAGLQPIIIVVHAMPLDALNNTLTRFNEEGRGAGIGVMASIQGGLPASLKEVHAKFGDVVQLKIFDYRDRANPRRLIGWDHLATLQSEGTYEQIRQNLSAALEEKWASKTISEAAYRQASGAHPLEYTRAMGGPGFKERGPDAHGRGVQTGDSQKDILSAPPGQQSSATRRRLAELVLPERVRAALRAKLDAQQQPPVLPVVGRKGPGPFR